MYIIATTATRLWFYFATLSILTSRVTRQTWRMFFILSAKNRWVHESAGHRMESFRWELIHKLLLLFHKPLRILGTSTVQQTTWNDSTESTYFFQIKTGDFGIAFHQDAIWTVPFSRTSCEKQKICELILCSGQRNINRAEMQIKTKTMKFRCNLNSNLQSKTSFAWRRNNIDSMNMMWMHKPIYL